jgi:Cu(I)/Ag(I) efflux system membrane fusion protein
MKNIVWIILTCLVIVIAFFVGRTTGHRPAQAAVESPQAEFWTCSMHPQVRQPDPGKCPICAMDLVPVVQQPSPSLNPREIQLSADAIALASIETVPVVRRLPTATIRMVGKVDFDETRLASITARVPGRLDRLYVDYTGISVNEGDHLVWLYSPDLLVAQQELLQALQTAASLNRSPDPFLADRSLHTVQAAREKLLLWGLTQEQVDAIERRQSPSDHLTINAPVGGIVIRKDAVEGMYVEEGTRIYTIADLSQLWVRLDAYESDLQWLHFGQKVEFTTEAYPGEQFEGWISFIGPVLDPTTRTVKVRVNVDNADGRLKPEMFVRAVVHSRVAASGKIISPDLAGKWVGPMHPEIVRDHPGPCPLCGMPLVPAQSLGYRAHEAGKETLPLVIPATAPLITGKRAVVYVALPDQSGVFEGRVVELGPRAGDVYIVESGLREGEQVVTHGAFKIDSAVQILAKPSMMNPGKANGTEGSGQASKGTPTHLVPHSFHQQLSALVDSYFPIADALSHDSLQNAKLALPSFQTALNGMDRSLLEGEAHAAWMQQLEGIQRGVNGIGATRDLEQARSDFEHISNGLIAAADTFGLPTHAPVYVYHCPMALGGKGADWLQNSQGTENPYYGSMMFSCGNEIRVIEGHATEGEAHEPSHQH